MSNSSPSSTRDPLLDQLWVRLSSERSAYVRRDKTPAGRKYQAAQEALLQTVKDVGRAGNINTINAAEKAALSNELVMYGNSPAMISSLQTAINDLDQANKHVSFVKDKDRYAMVNETFQRPKNRRSGLPYDEARQFFNSHNTRLLNQDRSRMSDLEKKTLNARRSNMRTAEKAYIALQQKALGIEPKKDKGRDRGLSR